MKKYLLVSVITVLAIGSLYNYLYQNTTAVIRGDGFTITIKSLSSDKREIFLLTEEFENDLLAEQALARGTSIIQEKFPSENFRREKLGYMILGSTINEIKKTTMSITIVLTDAEKR